MLCEPLFVSVKESSADETYLFVLTSRRDQTFSSLFGDDVEPTEGDQNWSDRTIRPLLQILTQHPSRDYSVSKDPLGPGSRTDVGDELNSPFTPSTEGTPPNIPVTAVRYRLLEVSSQYLRIGPSGYFSRSGWVDG